MTERGGFSASQVLASLLAALRDALPFVILRNYEDLPESWGHDVDILIRPSDLRVARTITLRTLRATSSGAQLCTLERLYFWSAQLACVDRVLQVDFYTAIAKGWVRYADCDKIFENQLQVHPLFSGPNLLHQSLLIAAKELLAYGRIRPRYHSILAGHDVEQSLAAAISLFSGRLTDEGCRLTAVALRDPTVTGRPAFRASAVLRPAAMVNWARLRMSQWRRLGDISDETASGGA